MTRNRSRLHRFPCTPAASRFRPALEALEDRLAPTATLLYSDNFTTNGNLNTYPNWTVENGGFTVAASQATATGFAGSDATVNNSGTPSYLQADVRLEGTVNLAGTGTRGVGLQARYAGPGDANMYLGWVASRNGATFAEIWKNLGGSWFELSAQQVSATTGSLVFNVAGSSLSLYFNGAPVGQVTDTSITAAGSFGIHGWSMNPEITNFNAYAMTGATVPALSTSSYASSFNTSSTSPYTYLGDEWTGRAGLMAVVSSANGGQVQMQASAASTTTLNLASPAANVELTANVAVTAGSGDRGSGLAARYQGPGANNMYVGWLADRSGIAYEEIWRNLGGTWTELAAQPTAGNVTTGALDFKVVGTSLTLTFNGQQIQASDSRITAPGLVGLHGWGTGPLLDSFTAAVATVPTTTLPHSNFNATTDTFVDNGGPWTLQIGNFTHDTVNHKVVSQGVNGSVATLNLTTNLSDSTQTAVVDLTSISGIGGFGLVARYSGPGDTNMYLGWICVRNLVTYAEIWRNIGGGWTELASQAVTGNGRKGTITFMVNGSNLSFSFNDGSNPATTITAFDGTIIGPGLIGIRSWNPGGTLTMYTGTSP